MESVTPTYSWEASTSHLMVSYTSELNHCTLYVLSAHLLMTESAVVSTPTQTGGVKSSSDEGDDDYSPEVLAISIAVTFLLTAIIVAVFVILISLLVNTYCMHKGHRKTSPNSYELPEKTWGSPLWLLQEYFYTLSCRWLNTVTYIYVHPRPHRYG